jgi:hypothetical protein
VPEAEAGGAKAMEQYDRGTVWSAGLLEMDCTVGKVDKLPRRFIR